MTNTWFDETTMKKLLYIVPWSWLETVWANLAVILDPPRREQTEGVPRKKRAILRNSKLFLEESHVSLTCYANVLRHVRSKNGGGRGRNESLVIKKLKLFRSNSFCLSFTLLFVFPSFFFWLVFVLLEKHKTGGEESSLNVDVTRCFTANIFLTYKSVSLIGCRFARLSFLLPRNAFGWTMKRRKWPPWPPLKYRSSGSMDIRTLN